MFSVSNIAALMILVTGFCTPLFGGKSIAPIGLAKNEGLIWAHSIPQMRDGGACEDMYSKHDPALRFKETIRTGDIEGKLFIEQLPGTDEYKHFDRRFSIIIEAPAAFFVGDDISNGSDIVAVRLSLESLRISLREFDPHLEAIEHLARLYWISSKRTLTPKEAAKFQELQDLLLTSKFQRDLQTKMFLSSWQEWIGYETVDYTNDQDLPFKLIYSDHDNRRIKARAELAGFSIRTVTFKVVIAESKKGLKLLKKLAKRYPQLFTSDDIYELERTKPTKFHEIRFENYEFVISIIDDFMYRHRDIVFESMLANINKVAGSPSVLFGRSVPAFTDNFPASPESIVKFTPDWTKVKNILELPGFGQCQSKSEQLVGAVFLHALSELAGLQNEYVIIEDPFTPLETPFISVINQSSP